MRNIGIGLIGVAGYGRSHLASIEACEQMGRGTLKSVTIRPEDSEPDLEAALSGRGVNVYRSVQEMLNSETSRVELVAVPVGIPAHSDLSIAALEAGYHVLCEKPVAGTYDEGLLMLEAGRRCDRTLAIGFQSIFTPAMQALKSISLDGRLGKLLQAKTRVLWPRGSQYYARNGWAGRLKSGNRRIYDSPIQNATAHFLNNMLYVAGPEADTSASPVELYGENYRAQRIESADTQYLRLTTDTGVELSMMATHASQSSVGPITEYIFEKGTVRYDASESGEAYHLDTVETTVGTALFPAQEPAQNRVDAFADTLDAIEKGRPPLCSIENALPHSLCVQTLFEESCPVRDVAPDYRSDIDDGQTSVNTVIPSIEELSERMFVESLSFSEAGAAWAAPGRKVNVTRC